MSDASSSPTTSLFGLNDLFNNPVFAGGIGLAGLGATAAFARRASIRAISLLKRRLLVSLEISKQDSSYQWILSWLALPRPPSNFLVSNLSRVHHLAMKTTSRSTKHEKEHAHFFLQPGYGSYLIRHERAFVRVNREKQSNASLDGREPHEIITLTTLYSQRNVFESIFQEAHRLAATAQEGKTIMYTARGMEWLPFGFGDARRKRPLDSVILDKGVKERIVGDVEDFLARQQWYVDRGIPYRRGYLLHGPPGSGKSSFIQALAGHLDFGIAIVNLSERGMTDDRLSHLFTKLPRRTILLLEDADAAFSNRKQVDEHGYSGATVTFSGLLNALDGVAAGEERIAFLTTNHIERLDPALIRPGRVDMIHEIGAATGSQITKMFERFYPDLQQQSQKKLKLALVRLGLRGNLDGIYMRERVVVSTATVQALCLFNKNNGEAAIRALAGLRDNKIPEEGEQQKEEGGVRKPGSEHIPPKDDRKTRTLLRYLSSRDRDRGSLNFLLDRSLGNQKTTSDHHAEASAGPSRQGDPIRAKGRTNWLLDLGRDNTNEVSARPEATATTSGKDSASTGSGLISISAKSRAKRKREREKALKRREEELHG